MYISRRKCTSDICNMYVYFLKSILKLVMLWNVRITFIFLTVLSGQKGLKEYFFRILMVVQNVSLFVSRNVCIKI